MKINNIIKKDLNTQNNWKIQSKGLKVTSSNSQLKNPNLSNHNPKNPKFSTIKVPLNSLTMIKK